MERLREYIKNITDEQIRQFETCLTNLVDKNKVMN